MNSIPLFNKKRNKNSSYQGEMSLALDNIIQRDFYTYRPSLKWIKVNTEFSLSY